MATDSALDAMSSEQRGLIETIRSDPGASFPRLVYADWLDEQGDPLADVVRVMEEIRERVERREPIDNDDWERFRKTTGFSILDDVFDRLSEVDRQRWGCDCVEAVHRQAQVSKQHRDRAHKKIHQHRQHLAQGEPLRRRSLFQTSDDQNFNYEASHRVLLRRAVSGLTGQIYEVARDVWRIVGSFQIEYRWQLLRALEYELHFVPEPEKTGTQPGLPVPGATESE